MKNSSRLAVVALASATLIALAGCSPASEPTDEPSSVDSGTIAFSPTSVQIPPLVLTGQEIEALATEAGFEFTIIDGNFDPTAQIQSLTQALDNGSVQALWVYPVAGPTAAPLVEHAQELGVPILVQIQPEDIGFDGPQPGVAFQGPKFSDFGEALGQEVVSCVEDKGLDTPEAILITGPDTLPGTGDIKAAAEAVYGDSVNVVAQAQASDVAEAQTQTTQLLGAHPDATVVISLLDEGALGAINAYRAAGKSVECLVLAGLGGPDTVAAQEAGDISAIVAFDYGNSVPDAWAAFQKLLDDPTAEGEVLDIPFTVTK
jgi:ABC-type sugar transport system substrate-binding protein